jgi:hypothetical protein
MGRTRFPRVECLPDADVRAGFRVRSAERSAADAVVKVGDATITFENYGPLELALFDAEVLEQPSPLTAEDRDQVDLELVEEPFPSVAETAAGRVSATLSQCSAASMSMPSPGGLNGDAQRSGQGGHPGGETRRLPPFPYDQPLRASPWRPAPALGRLVGHSTIGPWRQDRVAVQPVAAESRASSGVRTQTRESE